MTRREAQINVAIRAFAAGDALGVPWEGTKPAEIGTQPLFPLRAREGWPVGATSDDTAQLLLMAEALATGDPAAAFMARLAEEAPGIRGMGPSSLAAVERFRRDGSLVADGGATNGALMRAPAIGWGARDETELRGLVEVTTRTTHGDPSAIEAATEVALLAHRALGGGLAVGSRWRPLEEGVSMDAADSLAAIKYVLAKSRG